MLVMLERANLKHCETHVSVTTLTYAIEITFCQQQVTRTVETHIQVWQVRVTAMYSAQHSLQCSFVAPV
jgi:hypothetical protein